ncbi:MAG: radical SAM family heme chaperone HemW [Bdellovibrionota bacterium]
MSGTFGLYVHVPYCIKKCPYCDFNSYAIATLREGVPEERYTDALIRELRAYSALPEWQGRRLHSIFFGGGTPSLFQAASYGRFFSAVRECFILPANAEITLECNPGSIQETLGREKLSAFRECGVNRISMGAQSFRAEKLLELGRIHSGKETGLAVENVRAAGFESFNLDLIFGVGTETLSQWSDDLRAALDLEPTHLSAYGLTIEPGTEFSRLFQRGTLVVPDDDTSAEMYQLTQSTLRERGFEQYEISNYAKPGRACRHNLGYWNGEDYLGLGAGAHSYRSGNAGEFGARWSNIPGPEHYISRTQNDGTAKQRAEIVDRSKAELEFFFLGLRTIYGICPGSYEKRFSEGFSARFGGVVDELISHELIEQNGETLRLTAKGFLFADEVMKSFAEHAGDGA